MVLLIHFFISGFKEGQVLNKKSYSIYVVGVISALMLVLSMGCLFTPQKEFSESERRNLAKFPVFSMEMIQSG